MITDEIFRTLVENSDYPIFQSLLTISWQVPYGLEIFRTGIIEDQKESYLASFIYLIASIDAIFNNDIPFNHQVKNEIKTRNCSSSWSFRNYKPGTNSISIPKKLIVYGDLNGYTGSYSKAIDGIYRRNDFIHHDVLPLPSDYPTMKEEIPNSPLNINFRRNTP